MRQPSAVPFEDGNWNDRLSALQQWIEEQRIQVAALHSIGRPTRQAESLLQEMQRCRDTMRAYLRGAHGA